MYCNEGCTWAMLPESSKNIVIAVVLSKTGGDGTCTVLNVKLQFNIVVVVVVDLWKYK